VPTAELEGRSNEENQNGPCCLGGGGCPCFVGDSDCSSIADPMKRLACYDKAANAAAPSAKLARGLECDTGETYR
jgi:hypothetical protein